jgi:hypothetical protein
VTKYGWGIFKGFLPALAVKTINIEELGQIIHSSNTVLCLLLYSILKKIDRKSVLLILLGNMNLSCITYNS